MIENTLSQETNTQKQDDVRYTKRCAILHCFIVTVHCCVLCEATQGSLSLVTLNIIPKACLSQFHNHAQHKVRVSSLGGPTGFVDMTDWIKKVKRSIVSERR